MSEREDNDPLDSIEGHNLSIYRLKIPCAKAEIDIARKYAFDITIFALILIYYLFALLVDSWFLWVHVAYFGY
jgi:hypothetical protein